MPERTNRGLRAGAAVLAGTVALAALPAGGQTVEWPAYAADQAGTKYLPLDQIDAETVADLEIAWRQPVIPDAIRNGETARGPVASQTTPLMAGGLLYFSTGLGTVAALKPTTGEVVWNTGPSDGVRVRQTRGVAYWTDGEERRVVATLGPKLVSLDARTGRRDPGFGEAGEVDLREGLLRPFPDFYWNSAPIIVNDVVIIGSFVEDITTAQRTANKESPRGDVRGYDVRTGEHVWTFHTIPRENEFGVETWGADPVDDRASWEYSGNTNMWAHPTGAEELGIVYLPLLDPDQRLLRRAPARRQPVRGEPRRRRLPHRRAALALPGHPPRGVGLRLRLVGGTDGHHRRRAGHQGGGAAQQAGVHLRLRPGDGRAGVADRGPAGPRLGRARRAALADPAVPHEAAAVRAAGRDGGRPHRLHPRTEGRGRRAARPVRVGADVHRAHRARPAAGGQERHHLQPRHRGGAELERGRGRSRDRHALRAVRLQPERRRPRAVRAPAGRRAAGAAAVHAAARTARPVDVQAALRPADRPST